MASVRTACEDRIAELERALKVQQALADGLNRQLLKAEARIAELEAEVARLLDVAQKEPHTAYLEAVQRACDERMVALKHAEREARARAEEAERQLAEARAEAMREWRPIKTVPKDGTEILLLSECYAAWDEHNPAILRGGWRRTREMDRVLGWKPGSPAEGEA